MRVEFEQELGVPSASKSLLGGEETSGGIIDDRSPRGREMALLMPSHITVMSKKPHSLKAKARSFYAK